MHPNSDPSMHKEEHDEFKGRYILGEGYPFEDERLIGLLTNPVWDLGNIIELLLPDEILGEDGPKYRLVLERVEPSKRKGQ